MLRLMSLGPLLFGLVACGQGTVHQIAAQPNAGTGAPSGPPAAVCNPACSGAQVCSRAGVCVAPGHCAHSDDCLAGELCDLTSGLCVIDAQCGAQQLQAEAVPPNLLVVLDRSTSMENKINGVRMWDIAVGALIAMTAQHDQEVRFGLTLFPDREGDDCGQGTIPVPPAADTGPPIRTLLAAALDSADKNYPNGPGVTNIDAAMQQAATAPALADASRDRYVLLITDGKQANCGTAGGNAGTEQTVAELRTRGVTTFVLGFGDKVDQEQLNKLADLGGRPAMHRPNHYYQVDDQESFAEAVETIAKRSRLACSYALDQAPSTLTELHVYFDGHEVRQDTSHADGWDFDPQSRRLSFHGQACRDLELNRVAKLDVSYGCRRPGQGGVVGDCAAGVGRCSAPRECPEDHACLQGCCQPIVQ